MSNRWREGCQLLLGHVHLLAALNRRFLVKGVRRMQTGKRHGLSHCCSSAAEADCTLPSH